MAEVVRLREKVRDFNRPGTQVVPVATPTDAPGPAVDEEAQRAWLATVDEAVDDLIAALQRESDAINRGELVQLEDFARLKEQGYARLLGLLETADPEAGKAIGDEVAAALQRLDAAARRNLEALGALRGAVERIGTLLIKATEQHNSEGLYAESGRAVRPVEVSPAGVNLDL